MPVIVASNAICGHAVDVVAKTAPKSDLAKAVLPNFEHKAQPRPRALERQVVAARLVASKPLASLAFQQRHHQESHQRTQLVDWIVVDQFVDPKDAFKKSWLLGHPEPWRTVDRS